MQVAGLLSHEQLSAIFLNVEELTEVNRQFTESLRDAIEIALDEGDEDLCTVKIGQIFKETEPMLSAFKSYCTRQVCIKILFSYDKTLKLWVVSFPCQGLRWHGFEGFGRTRQFLE